MHTDLDLPSGGTSDLLPVSRPQSRGQIRTRRLHVVENRSLLTAKLREPALAPGPIERHDLRTIPPEPHRASGSVRDHEHRCRHLEIVETGHRVVEDTGIPIVEGDDRGLVERRAAVEAV